MIYPLWLRVPHRTGESPQSLLSRLAVRNGVVAAEFCDDMGLPVARVSDGTPHVIDKLADLAGVDRKSLLVDAIVGGEDGLWRLRGQVLRRGMLRRDRLLVCVECLAGDLAGCGCPPAEAVYGRTAWMLDHVRTCPLHEVALTEMPRLRSTPSVVHDFSARIRPFLDDVARHRKEAVRRKASGLEHYILGRLEGHQQADWLDGLPFHVAVQTCERVGAVALFGPEVSFRGLDDDEWRAAGGVGFDVMSLGTGGFADFLDVLRVDQASTLHANSLGRKCYGSLWEFLLRCVRDPDYSSVRQLVAEQIAKHRPVPEEREILGCSVPGMKVHSIRTAALATGKHPKRLRKILSRRGLIAPGHEGKSDGMVTFDAETAADLLTSVRGYLTLKDMESYLNASRSPVQVLYKAGLLIPAVRIRKPRTGWLGFDRGDIDAFLERLLSATVECSVVGPGEVTIPAAARRAHCGIAEVTRLVLDRRLRWAGRLASERGFMSVLVRSEEVTELTRGPEMAGMAACHIRKRLQVEWQTVDRLIEGGLLERMEVAHPVTKAPVRVVTQESLERFESEYVSIARLAQERGIHLLKLKHWLAKRAVQPALAPGKFGSVFLRWSDVPNITC